MELRQADSRRRCPLCHDHLEAERTKGCAGCGTDYHSRCLSELGGCSTMGCAAKGVPVEREWQPLRGVSGPQAVRRSMERAAALVVWLLAALALAVAAAMAFKTPAAWPLYSIFGFAGFALIGAGFHLFRSSD